MRVGFTGLGLMGLPMARNLLRAGHRLVVHSSRREAAQQLSQDGATLAPSIAKMAGDVDILCSCRVTPAHSLDVFTGPDGALAGGHAGLVCVDFATIDPQTSRSIAARLRARGIGFLDAPVSGGPEGAAAASLSIMVGGRGDDVARARPVLEALGRSIFHLGDNGNGLAAKLCNNLITGTLHALIAEAMVLGAKLGLPGEQLYQVLRASSARSTTLERVVPNHFLPRRFEPASALSMIIKDLECVTSTAKAAGVRLLLPTVAQQMFVEAEALGHGDKDLAAVILPMETIAGVRVGRE